MKFNQSSITDFKQKIDHTLPKLSGLINFLLTASTILVLISIIKFISIYLPRTFLSSTLKGDEMKYHGDLISAINEGLATTINSGVSISFLSINYFISNFIVDPIMSIRWTSLSFGLILILTFIIFARKIINSQVVFLQTSLILLYYLTIQLTLFVGYNDLVMHFFGFLIWILLLKGDLQKNRNYLFMGLIFALVLATRKMGIIYFLVFIIIFLSQMLFQDTDKKLLLKNLMVITSSLIFFLFLINITSLTSGNGLSFDDKILGGPVNWSQWEYHNALLIDEGKQERFHHVKIEETNEFLIANGQHSLPSTFLEMITFDISFTIKEFLIDSAIATKYFFRQTGFWPFLFVFFFLLRIKKVPKNKITSTDFIYLFSLSYFIIICFIVITNIQMRWFTFFVPIMFILIAKDLEKTNPLYQKIFFTINNLWLSMMFLPLFANNV